MNLTKFCIDCVNFKPAQYHGGNAICLIDYKHNIVYGHREYRSCYNARDEGKCGPSAINFKARVPDELL